MAFLPTIAQQWRSFRTLWCSNPWKDRRGNWRKSQHGRVSHGQGRWTMARLRSRAFNLNFGVKPFRSRNPQSGLAGHRLARRLPRRIRFPCLRLLGLRLGLGRLGPRIRLGMGLGLVESLLGLVSLLVVYAHTLARRLLHGSQLHRSLFGLATWDARFSPVRCARSGFSGPIWKFRLAGCRSVWYLQRKRRLPPAPRPRRPRPDPKCPDSQSQNSPTAPKAPA